MVPQRHCNVTINSNLMILMILTRFHDDFAMISTISLQIPQILDNFTKFLTILQRIHDDFDNLYKFDNFTTNIFEQNKFVGNDFTTTTISGRQLHNNNVVMMRRRQQGDNAAVATMTTMMRHYCGNDVVVTMWQ